MDQSRKLLLMAETGADIPPELAEKYNIQIVPMHITFGAETKDDGSFPSEEICAFYDRTGILSKTSGSVPEDFTQAFDEAHEKWPQAGVREEPGHRGGLCGAGGGGSFPGPAAGGEPGLGHG